MRRSGKPVTDYLCKLAQVIPPEPAEKDSVRHVDIGGIPPLGYNLLTDINGRVSFPNLTEGTWEMYVYESKDIFNEDGTSNLVRSYTFTIDQKNPQRNTVIFLPQK